MSNKPPALPRFWAAIVKADGCWLWTRANNGRYGLLSVNGRDRLAHRFAYEHFRGPIPVGMQIDHLCRKSLCVNPDHLEVVTNRQNTLRGVSNAAVNAKKTHCLNGHEFTPENTRLDRKHKVGVERVCRTCLREYWRQRRRKRRVS